MDSRAEGVLIIAVHFGLMGFEQGIKIINLSKRRVKNGGVGTGKLFVFL